MSCRTGRAADLGQLWPLQAFLPASSATLPQLGVDHTVQLTLDVTDRQLHLIEERRPGGLHLLLVAIQPSLAGGIHPGRR
jgi:hypothetical protein